MESMEWIFFLPKSVDHRDIKKNVSRYLQKLYILEYRNPIS